MFTCISHRLVRPLHCKACYCNAVLWLMEKMVLKTVNYFEIVFKIVKNYLAILDECCNCIANFSYYHQVSSVCRLSFITRAYWDKTHEARIVRLSLKSSPLPPLFCILSLTTKFREFLERWRQNKMQYCQFHALYFGNGAKQILIIRIVS